MKFITDKIYGLDYTDYLKILPKNSVDLAIIDPPYNLKKAEWDMFISREAFLSFTYDWIDKTLPTMKETGTVYIFNTPDNAAFILQHLLKRGLKFQNWITWYKKDGFTYSKKKYISNQETILFFTMSDNYTFNADEIRTPYHSTSRIAHAQKVGILKNGKRWFPNPNGKLASDVWEFSSERHKNKVNGKVMRQAHLTPKPLDMVERMVLASSKPDDLVMDCFIGSGTTAVAAKKHSRHFTGTENNKEYLKIAEERLSNL